MPLCQSALFGYIAAELTEIYCHSQGETNPRKIELYKAGACAAVGGTSAVLTVDPLGGALVAAETIAHLASAATGVQLPKLPPELSHA